MHTLFLMAILSLCGSIYAMDRSGHEYNLPSKTTRVLGRSLSTTPVTPPMARDLQPGSTLKWHTREYRITEKVVQEPQITIVMERDKHRVCGTFMITEQITRTFNNSTDRHPKTTTGTDNLSPECIKALKTAAHIGTLLIIYALSNL